MMATELKTLQDIQNQKGFHNLKQYSKAIPQSQMYNRVMEGSEEMAVFPSDIKEEVIKHLKTMLESPNCDHSNCFPGSECKECINDPVIEFIKEFFNITREDCDAYVLEDER